MATTTQWMNEHPECAAAAGSMSNVGTEADYREQGRGELFEKAQRAMRNPEFVQMTTDYKKHAGMWATDKVLLMEQVCSSLDDSALPANTGIIAAQVDTIPWLATAASAARQKYASTFARSLVEEKRK